MEEKTGSGFTDKVALTATQKRDNSQGRHHISSMNNRQDGGRGEGEYQMKTGWEDERRLRYVYTEMQEKQPGACCVMRL